MLCCKKKKEKIGEILAGKELYIARFIAATQRPLAFLSFWEIYFNYNCICFACCKRIKNK